MYFRDAKQLKNNSSANIIAADKTAPSQFKSHVAPSSKPQASTQSINNGLDLAVLILLYLAD